MKRLQIYLPDGVYADLRLVAEANRVSIGSFVRSLLTAHFNYNPTTEDTVDEAFANHNQPKRRKLTYRK